MESDPAAQTLKISGDEKLFWLPTNFQYCFECYICRWPERLTGRVNTLLQASEMLISDCKG